MRDSLVEALAVTEADAFLTSCQSEVKDSERLRGKVKNKYPEKKVSVLGVLSTKYDEVAAAKGLVTAKRAANSKDLATKLQADQLSGWLNSEKSVKDVFRLLRITDTGVLSAKSRKLETLDEYIKRFNEKNSQHQTDLFRALRGSFGGEDKLAVVVSRAMSFSPEEAFKIRQKLFERWIKKEYDPASVLTKVFKVPENNMASITSEMKLVTNQYKPVYNRVKGIRESATYSSTF
ncbi:hypothetical protein GN958_ATG17020 [Phytophthora infestans]|uniref:Uncharacterized protein n=1 Tax=Phytophthora infestans TaxID=4787 RepID=A0A8S9U054_PHYIN|nr:hypothetical protein GN958_ATG17020 [Phytophthora infestans]